MNAIKTYTASLALAAVAALTFSACGGSTTSSAPPSSPGGSVTAQTISLSKVDGVGEILVDGNGDTLYAADQEADGKVLCTGSCASIWLPLTLPAGVDTPTAGSDLAANVSVVQRPDGKEQVAFDGKPLYRFAQDQGPGAISGNGLSDNFNGMSFTWHVASPGPLEGGASSSPRGGSGY
jgi:predicted lipoprotein with Yx(FWY)xxD motif